ncbi:MAG TPA: GxxExxY protein [Gemmatimonadaceae bacterium]|nr:GxxExxY protein [Gemmatimonadaceae bacterium]
MFPLMRGELIHDRLTHSVIGAFFEVHNTLGFGFLEQLYIEALAIELRERGHVVDLEVSVRVSYKGIEIGWQRVDMIVDGLLVLEVKSTAELHATARRQLLNYLCATRLDLGLLLHFGPSAKFYRVVAETASGGPNS